MPKSAAKSFVLVDGSSYLFRAYYALPALTNSKGEPTGAIYGVLNMLKKLVKEYQPDHIVVVFDPKGKTFRYDLYPEYKANRTEMPDDLRVQIAPLHDAIRALGFPLVIVDGVEADDVIGTLATQAQDQDMKIIISTGDKDLAQLVNAKVTLINTMTDHTLDVKGVKEKFGVSPERIIDLLALMGDTVDNIPGVPKVGPKTAAKWIAEYGSLDKVVAHADEIKGKVGENLRAHLSELPLSRELVTVKCDVDLDMPLEKLSMSAPNRKQLAQLFADLEFKSWLKEVKGEGAKTTPIKQEYDLILNNKQFEVWLDKLNKAKLFAFDTETTSLNAMQAQLVGVSFSVEPGKAAYLPLMHDYMDAPKQLDKDKVLQSLKPVLEDPERSIVGQNLKYDIEVLRRCGIQIGTKLWDTLLESYVLNTSTARHDMDTLALKYLDRSTIKFEDVAGKGAKQLTFNQIHLDEAAPYAAEDADVTLQLHQTLLPLIKEHPKVLKVLTDIELPLMPILASMEYQGVLIDAKKLKIQSTQLQKRITEIEEQAYKLAGSVFNLASPKQLQEILYDQLKLPILKKTPKGQPSTAENVLQELAMDYPLPKLILEYRSLAKLKSTYTDRLPEQINPETGRVHTSYNQAVTATGRLSSKDPNLQNIPARTEEGRKIRQAFIAEKGYQILAADYSQVELRIMAHLSQDLGLLKAFEEGLDVHRATASEVFGVALDAVTPDQRRHAKAINFGLMYGMSSFGLAQQLGISRKDAQEYIDIYFARYPKVHAYMEEARAVAAKQGYVETLLGRRVLVPEIKSSNVQRRKAAERAAINAPLQGSSADVIKLAMICVDRWVWEKQVDIKMIMQVHDELVFEVADSIIDIATEEIRCCMESAVTLSVPLLVDIGVGANWDEAH